jgi:uncharacterized metal-binding protein
VAWTVVASLMAGVSGFYELIFINLGLLFGYVVLGSYIDPDLDQVGITSAEGRMMKDFKLLGTLMVAYWVPYGWLMKHRGALSHSIILSTAIRFAYMLLPVIVLVLVLDLPKHLWYNDIVLGLVEGMFIGLCVADALHIIADGELF